MASSMIYFVLFFNRVQQYPYQGGGCRRNSPWFMYIYLFKGNKNIERYKLLVDVHLSQTTKKQLCDHFLTNNTKSGIMVRVSWLFLANESKWHANTLCHCFKRSYQRIWICRGLIEKLSETIRSLSQMVVELYMQFSLFSKTSCKSIIKMRSVVEMTHFAIFWCTFLLFSKK
jgi:hypothetical protein